MKINKCSYLGKINRFILIIQFAKLPLKEYTKFTISGVKVDENLSFLRHFELNASSLQRYFLLGFVKLICFDFNDVDTMTSIHL